MNYGITSEHRPDATRVFNEHRDLLISVAYRVLGSVTEAEIAAMKRQGVGRLVCISSSAVEPDHVL